MTISVIGLGYIGIPLAALIAKSGQNVLGYDSNKTVVENINNGISKIQEDDFVELLSHIALSGLLKAETVLNRMMFTLSLFQHLWMNETNRTYLLYINRLISFSRCWSRSRL